ncbi:hypothetical protein BT69DRAFT_1225419 [Atractiella rhizophila]|nr:hypothetical protein BT69DRAFT_1225419 [Atractiella rhizophila]
MHDRMLVKVEWTIQSLPPGYNETIALGIKKDTEPWEEFAVVWKRGKIELWVDYKIPLRESFSGHKRLKHVIPIKPGKTRLSLYSFTDRIFCLYFEPTEVFSRNSGKAQKRGIFHWRHEGTNIFLFRARCPSIGSDWLWQLFLELGGKIPETLELNISSLDITVRFPIPELAREGAADFDPDGQTVGQMYGKGLKFFTVQNLIDHSTRLLEGYSEFSNLVEERRKKGGVLALAWRRGQLLDWVSEEFDMEGKERINAVIGPAVMLANPSKRIDQDLSLELRVAQHYPTYVSLGVAKRLNEPSPIEGYVSRIRLKTDTKERLYLATYDGHLFVITRQHAFPPDPPTHAPTPEEPVDETPMERFRRKEKARAVHHIMRCQGYLDLRDIIAVVRWNPDLLQKTKQELSQLTVADSDPTPLPDEKDMSPEELRIKRSFAVIVGKGALYRFEAMSPQVAGEWISRLNELARYWKRRQQEDAAEQMEITPSTHDVLNHFRKKPDDDEVSLDDRLKFGGPLLGAIYNWCILNGCRTIIKCGRLYIRAGVNKLYKERYMIIVDGHLLQFLIPPRHEAVKTGQSEVYHQRKNITSLKDCYVYTGRMVNIRYKANSRFNPANLQSNNFPRIYPDGLMSIDAEDECTFVIFRKISNDGKGLGKRGTARVMRARSKVERDEWVFALNTELEKLVRKDRKHEEGMRDFGKTTMASSN